MAKIIFIRHGVSIWDQEKRFIGWTDVPLIENRQDLKSIGRKLLENRYHIDYLVTSVLERSIVSGWTVLDTLNRTWIPEIHDWRLNPRHYGEIQGLTYQEALAQDQATASLRASWDQRPPSIEQSDIRHPCQDRRYQDIPAEFVAGESLVDVCSRVEEALKSNILPILEEDKKVLIVAHEDSIKACIRFFEKLSVTETLKINIPLAKALILDYKESGEFSRYYLD